MYQPNSEGVSRNLLCDCVCMLLANSDNELNAVIDESCKCHKPFSCVIRYVLILFLQEKSKQIFVCNIIGKQYLYY